MQIIYISHSSFNASISWSEAILLEIILVHWLFVSQRELRVRNISKSSRRNYCFLWMIFLIRRKKLCFVWDNWVILLSCKMTFLAIEMQRWPHFSLRKRSKWCHDQRNHLISISSKISVIFSKLSFMNISLTFIVLYLNLRMQ